MSGMIPSGAYMVSNVAYPDRYISMSGDRDLVGHEAGDKVCVHCSSNVLHVLIDAHRSKSMSRTRLRILQLSLISRQGCTLGSTKWFVCLVLTDATLLTA
jgi:hypothetical protein